MSPSLPKILERTLQLGASKDIPIIKMVPISESPKQYLELVKQFRIHIPDQLHLKDDMQMVQLRMHVTGDTECTISGLGSQGMMYPTALRGLN